MSHRPFRMRRSMPYLPCPNCGLTLARLGPIAWIDRCPRCLHRRRASVVLLEWGGPRARLGSAEAGQPAIVPSLGTESRPRRKEDGRARGELALEEEGARNGYRGSRARAHLHVAAAGSAAAVGAMTP